MRRSVRCVRRSSALSPSDSFGGRGAAPVAGCVPAAANVPGPSHSYERFPVRCIPTSSPTSALTRNAVFLRYFAVLQWSYFLKEFGATAAVGVGVGRKCAPLLSHAACAFHAPDLTRAQRFLAVLISFAIYRQQLNLRHIAGVVIFFGCGMCRCCAAAARPSLLTFGFFAVARLYQRFPGKRERIKQRTANLLSCKRKVRENQNPHIFRARIRCSRTFTRHWALQGIYLRPRVSSRAIPTHARAERAGSTQNTHDCPHLTKVR